MTKFEYKESHPWPVFAIFSFPLMTKSNIFISVLIISIFIFFIFIFNYRYSIITDNEIYIEKYLWKFKKKYTYFYSDLSHVKINYSYKVPNITFYFKEPTKKKVVAPISGVFLRELYAHFKKKNIKVISDTPSYLR